MARVLLWVKAGDESEGAFPFEQTGKESVLAEADATYWSKTRDHHTLVGRAKKGKKNGAKRM